MRKDINACKAETATKFGILRWFWGNWRQELCILPAVNNAVPIDGQVGYCSSVNTPLAVRVRNNVTGAWVNIPHELICSEIIQRITGTGAVNSLQHCPPCIENPTIRSSFSLARRKQYHCKQQSSNTTTKVVHLSPCFDSRLNSFLSVLSNTARQPEPHWSFLLGASYIATLYSCTMATNCGVWYVYTGCSCTFSRWRKTVLHGVYKPCTTVTLG